MGIIFGIIGFVMFITAFLTLIKIKDILKEIDQKIGYIIDRKIDTQKIEGKK